MGKKGLTSSTRRILFLIPCSDLIPSGKVRVLNYLPYFRNHSVETKVFNYQSPFILRATRRARPKSGLGRLVFRMRKGILACLGMVYRRYVEVRLIVSARRYHAIFIQWQPIPRYAIWALIKRNPNLIFDLDDPVFLQWELNTKFLIARSKLVIAGSGYLRDYSRTWNHHVILIPSPVPLERFDPYQNTSLSHPNSPTIVGWIGSESTLSHIEILIDVFDVLRERYPLHVKVIGTGDAPCPISRKDNLEVTTIPYYDEEEMIRQVFSFNIGVVPLRQSEATRGKTGLKALIYMAAGIPVVCSPVGENLEFVTDGVTGYCASTPEDWVEKLDRLVRDASLRRRMGEEGLALVREKYATEICFEFLYRALCSTVLGDQEASS